jgi:hypothetical protein
MYLMAIRPLLIGLTLILALVLIILSILLVNPSHIMHQSEPFATQQPGVNPHQ